MNIRALVIGLLIATGSVACSSGNDDDSPAAQACSDLADVLSRVAQRCGYDYEQSRREIIQGLANGDCSNVVAVRDTSRFQAQCIPSLNRMSCEDLERGTIDSSCRHQLLREKNMTPSEPSHAGIVSAAIQ